MKCFPHPLFVVVEVTTRTIQGRFLLRPSAELNSIILGVLGRAQHLYKVKVHDYVFLSNHYHLLVSVTSVLQLARFMGYFNGNLAKEVLRRTDWRDKVWGRRYQAILVSNEERAQLGRLRYILAHGAKENLVASPRDWPGVASLHAHFGLADPHGMWFDRTKEFSARQRGIELTFEERTQVERVELTPLPCLTSLSKEARRAVLEDMLSNIEEETARLRSETGSKPLGRRAVLRQRPTDGPRRSKRSPAPFAHCASKGARQALFAAYSWFLAAYLDAREVLRKTGAASFPEGSFPPPAPFVAPLLEPG